MLRQNVKQLKRLQAGVTLIELMVALGIGAFLMIGAVTVFMQSRTSFRVTESVSRLQENGRFVIDALEPDIRMARYWGLTTRTDKIANRASPTDPNGIGVDTCGVNWLINLDADIEVRNNGNVFPCLGTFPGQNEPLADTITIRRTVEDATPPAALVNNRMYVWAGRYFNGQIFNNGAMPPDYVPGDGSEVHQLVVNGYYVSRSSSLGPGIPSLRMHTLMGDGTIQDQEVLTGVEDMQVQFGVDTDVIGAANRGSIDRYVNANDPILDPLNAAFIPSAEILAVRIWLRLRADRIENGFTDTAAYQYADRNQLPFNDGFRRIVVMKTIYVRNARQAS
jgi:prepilin-type N-terminal cleavage/methylation domain-containing protein